MDVIEYTPSMGEINLTEEMRTTLTGLPIESQAKHFVVRELEDWKERSNGEFEVVHTQEHTKTPEKCEHARSWIVQDGIIVGIVFKSDYAFLNKSVETGFIVEDDGTLTYQYCSLVWIP